MDSAGSVRDVRTDVVGRVEVTNLEFYARLEEVLEAVNALVSMFGEVFDVEDPR
jgi:hypothetical protein